VGHLHSARSKYFRTEQALRYRESTSTEQALHDGAGTSRHHTRFRTEQAFSDSNEKNNTQKETQNEAQVSKLFDKPARNSREQLRKTEKKQKDAPRPEKYNQLRTQPNDKHLKEPREKKKKNAHSNKH
jgi:hypothetical protein